MGSAKLREDRVESLLAIRELHQRYGHIQEVIIQNFRVKPDIPMRNWPEPTQADMLRTIAVARLLMPEVNLQAPPNLSAPNYEDLLDAGINDWGGVSPLTPDFINPERPWPHLDELQRRTESKGFMLAAKAAGLSGVSASGDVAPRVCSRKKSGAARFPVLCAEGSMIVVLTGGTGGAKFVDGLRQVAPAQELTFVVNTGDDLQWWGLYVSPDLDSITYALVGPAQPGTRLGSEGRHFFLPAGDGRTGRADLVPRGRPRPRDPSAALENAGGGKNSDRSYYGNLRQAGGAGAHPADEQLAGGDQS